MCVNKWVFILLVFKMILLWLSSVTYKQRVYRVSYTHLGKFKITIAIHEFVYQNEHGKVINSL